MIIISALHRYSFILITDYKLQIKMVYLTEIYCPTPKYYIEIRIVRVVPPLFVAVKCSPKATIFCLFLAEPRTRNFFSAVYSVRKRMLF